MIKNFADHAANERTFLSWVRTVTAIVGFGLATARLSDTKAQLWSEVSLLIAGAFVILVAFLRMRHLSMKIRSTEMIDDTEMGIDIFLVILVVCLFLMLGVFTAHIGHSF